MTTYVLIGGTPEEREKATKELEAKGHKVVTEDTIIGKNKLEVFLDAAMSGEFDIPEIDVIPRSYKKVKGQKAGKKQFQRQPWQ